MSGQKSIDGQMGLTRREVLIAASTLAASWGAVRVFNQAPPVSGALVGANSKAGHILRSQFDRSPDQFVDSGTVVVGGGIAGLSAAWWLQKQGHQNFELLELDKIVGGNSQSGENQTSRFPWGAHYVPAPGPDAKYVRLLFEELGIIEGYSSEGLPIYNEYAICGAPKERLYLHGRWQTGMVPKLGLKPKDKQQIEEFDGFIETQALRVGADGRPAFTIPVDLSSQDPEILYLDQMSMAQFLDKRGWDSQALRWYINYCCRDDFGSDLANTSAWAGIHYFASRSGNAANLKEEVVVTWPEGNGWLVRQLKAKLSENIKTDQLVFAIKNTSSGVIVDSIDTETLRVTRRLAERVIFAGPQYVAQHLISEVSKQRADDFEYSPWVVANLTVAKLPP
jgi:phytoene dehydrogenase-like protein